MVLLVVGFVLEVKPMFDAARPQPAGPAARWLLWTGTAGLLAGVATGFLGTHSVMGLLGSAGPWREHRFLGIWVAATFTAISLWRFLAGRRPSGLLALVWLTALWVLGSQILAGRRLAEMF
ncbi:MAG: hypothetical protein IPP35_02690 [Elusimicrobia bacterium]|nr:hypothetical protein [Elusimicrobiota bacterium]